MGSRTKLGRGEGGESWAFNIFLINILSCANKEKTRCLKGGKGDVFSKFCSEARSGKTYCSKVFIKRGGWGGMKIEIEVGIEDFLGFSP